MHETVWLGRGGQGAFTAARLLGLSAVRFAGRQALAFPSFGPERRGAPVFAYTRISDAPIYDRSAVRRADTAVIMDRSLASQVSMGFLTPQSLVIVDTEDSAGLDLPGRLLRVPARRLAREILGSDRTNTLLLGVLIGATGLLPALAVADGIAAELGAGARGARNAAAFDRGCGLGSEWAAGAPERGAPHVR
jgi:pyruvate ferredoxin oxidoreductase gamma subunit